MSFYIRKSIKAGPFRFNLSKSGIGVSTGVPGLRVGTGPRGSYVRMGGHGIYYQQTVSSNSGHSPAGTRPAPSVPVPANEVILEDVTGATTIQLSVASSSDLVEQVNEAARRVSFLPLIVLLCLPILTIPAAIWLGRGTRRGEP